jgi:uncharacterized protein YjeT (DUF2065 family)
MQELAFAVALLLIAEGIGPFLAPGMWRETMRRLVNMQDGQLRFIGLVSLLSGALLLWLF